MKSQQNLTYVGSQVTAMKKAQIKYKCNHTTNSCVGTLLIALRVHDTYNPVHI